MKHMRTLTIIIFITATTVCLSSGNFEKKDENKFLENFRKYTESLLSTDDIEREKTFKSIQEFNDQLIDELIKIANEKLPNRPAQTVQDIEYIKHDAKYHAIILLGEMRAVKSVSMLFENLEYKSPYIGLSSGYQELGQEYISANTLSKIGMPAIEPALDQLKKFNKNDSKGIICCWIIQDILGVKLAKANIQIAINETKDENVKKNLNEAITYIENRYGNSR
jgi:hypothetical protein